MPSFGGFNCSISATSLSTLTTNPVSTTLGYVSNVSNVSTLVVNATTTPATQPNPTDLFITISNFLFNLLINILKLLLK
jgi:hypothetical protein